VSYLKGRIIGAIVIILLGVSMLLQRLGIADISLGRMISTFWPVIFIVIGLSLILDNKREKTKFYKNPNYNNKPDKSDYKESYDSQNFGNEQAGPKYNENYQNNNDEQRKINGDYQNNNYNNNYEYNQNNFNDANYRTSDDYINKITIFSGADERVFSKNFKGGNALTAFGGINIDLRNAIMSGMGTKLTVISFFGGITIRIPQGVRVITNGVPMFGGLTDKTKSNAYTDNSPIIRVNYFTAFGGIDIRN
jgi:predicted membrane protein